MARRRRFPIALALTAALTAAANGRAGVDPQKRVQGLVKTLANDKSGYERGMAADALGKLGPAAVSGMPTLLAALKDQDKFVRGKAISAIGKVDKAEGDRQAAILVAQDPEPDVRRSAVFVLSDREALARVARGDADAKTRGIAIAKLDEGAIAEIVAAEADADVLREALGRIKDPERLKWLATNGKRPAREEALGRLPSPTVIDIAKTHPDQDVRIDAVMQVSDPKVLAEIAANDKSPAVRDAATLSSQGDPSKDLKIESLDCKREAQLAGTCVVRIANTGKIAYAALEYRMSGLAHIQNAQRLEGRIESGQSREFKIPQLLSSSAGSVEIVLAGARKVSPASK